MRTKYKPWAEPYVLEHTEVTLQAEDLQNYDDFYLEIGSGKGAFLLGMAMNNPDKKFVGVERNVTCCGFTAKKLVEAECQNGKLIFDNADRVLLNIKDKSVDTLFLNFSDPWPKKRHSKRRLTAESYLDSYYRILKDDGKLIFKTDNFDLFEFSIEKIEESKFKIISRDDNYDGLDPFDVQTEYETAFRNEGQPIYRVILGKK